MKEYIVIRFGEDGPSVDHFTRTEIYSFLEEAVEEEYEFIDEIPKDTWQAHLDGKYLVIKGEVIVPKAEAVVKQYSID